MELAIDALISRIDELGNPSCVGLDTCIEYLPEHWQQKCGSFEDAAKYIRDFNFGIIDAISDIVPCVKVQIACYEMYGIEGMRSFCDTINYARSKGLSVIADAKRGDIGSTAKCYSAAYLGRAKLQGKELPAFESDFVTVNAYLGSDGIKPFLEDVGRCNKGIFILVKTSNPASGELQDRRFEDGRTLYEAMGDYVIEWGKPFIGRYDYSAVGAVVGCTHRRQAESLRKRLKGVFFLIPGYGAQGGKAEDIAVCFDEQGRGGIVNSSRAILTAHQGAFKGLDFANAAREAALIMREELSKAIKGRANG
mgnify:CR=1 FL=1